MLEQGMVWLNAVANALGRVFFAPIGFLPGWLSATVVAAATGLLLLIVFKYTSHQRAIKSARNDIKANLLTLKLFKDSALIALGAQGRILHGAFRLMVLALVPMLVMTVPVLLLLGQLAPWYQSRPLRVGEETVVTLKLRGDPASSWPEVRLKPNDAIEVTAGPVRVQSKREICWSIKARQPGYHQLEFEVDGEVAGKELAIGDGYMRVSTRRPAWNWSDILLYPCEAPFRPESAIHSIEMEYPERASWTSGTDSWVIYWFVVSMVSALCFRRALNVNV
jgi:uncharacterized membrane protein (DUF106 family)